MKTKYLIGKTLLLGFACSITICMASCSTNDIVEGSTSARAISFDVVDAGVTRAQIDGSTMTTCFEVGDEAGVYGVRNGQVVDGLENLKLTYNENGFWDAGQTIEYSSSMDGVTFYGYYPYDEQMQFDASAADGFAEHVSALKVDYNQSTKAAFSACDFMNTGACGIDAAFHSVKLAMHHRQALVSIELPNSSYIFTNTDPYVLEKAEDAYFKLGNTTISPYFDEQSQSYRLILPSGTTDDLSVSFKSNGNSKSYTVTNISNILEGQYANYIVDGGAMLVNATLEVGDFYCADGKVVKKDTPQSELPNNIIGVVYHVGTTDGIVAANSKCKHAMVVGLTNTEKAWGTSGSTSSAQNSAGWKTWYKSYGLSDLGTTSAASISQGTLECLGYENTIAWTSVPEPLTIGDYTLDYTSVFNTVYKQQQEDVCVPEVSTCWFIPSLADWMNISSVADEVEQSLAKCEAEPLNLPQEKPGYWSSNIRAAAAGWCYMGSGTASSTLFYARSYKDTAKYRFILAF